MNRSTRSSQASVLLAFLLALPAGSAHAAVSLFDSGGFESPAYALGDLEGQNGWQATVGVLGTAVVQSSTVSGGSQAVQVDRAAGGDDRYGVLVSPTQRFVCVTWDMRVQQTVSNDFGPFFGVEAYDDSGAALARLGGLGVDASTGDVLYFDSAVGLAETGQLVAFGEWNAFQIDFDLGLQQYSVFLNGAELLTTDFESPATTITDVDLAALAASATGGDLTGTAYFDNFRVVETDSKRVTSVPDGGTTALLSLLAFGGLGMLRRWLR